MSDLSTRTAVQPEAGWGEQNLTDRQRVAAIWHLIFQGATMIGIIALIALLFNIVNSAFGLVALQNQIEPHVLVARAGYPDGTALAELPKEVLVAILKENISAGSMRRLERDLPFAERTQEDIYQLVLTRVVKPKVVGTWSLVESLTRRAEIEATVAKIPHGTLEFRSWVNANFLRSPQSSDPQLAGARTAILGSLWTILITIVIAFPIGVGAAIYLEEYAADTWMNRLIQTNINNLAGVPSIIYGMLGLAIFVRSAGGTHQRRGSSALSDPDDGQRPHDPLGRPDAGLSSSCR
jgi:phosphate transport system permease protein